MYAGRSNAPHANARAARGSLRGDRADGFDEAMPWRGQTHPATASSDCRLGRSGAFSSCRIIFSAAAPSLIVKHALPCRGQEGE